MNNIRRKSIKNLTEKFESLKSELEKIIDEEQDYFDNMPENLQGSERGMNSEESIDLMNEALENIESAIESLEEVN